MKRIIVIGAVLVGAGHDGGAMPQDRKAPELDGGTGWFNTEKPIRLAELKGKVVLLDFWTYC